MQRLVLVAEPIITWQGTFKQKKANNNVDIPEHYLANISLGLCVGHPLVEVDYPFLLPHAALYHIITKRGMGVKHGVEGRVDQMLGDMKQQFCKQFNKDHDT